MGRILKMASHCDEKYESKKEAKKEMAKEKAVSKGAMDKLRKK